MAYRKTRTLTADEQAKRDERRARFRDLARAIGAMTDAQRAEMAARMVGVVTIEGRALSVHNSCLVAAQNAGATVLGGFQQWRAAGRMVRKGEHGLMIWAPVRPRESPADGQQQDAGERPGFIMVTVFDVSQTEDAQQQQAPERIQLEAPRYQPAAAEGE